MKRPSQLLAIHSPRRLTARIAVSALLALLVSPAMAQVNGPGPSPASEFDTVLNLPGDEAVIDSSQRIPISSGQTTQLNVTDGGEIGSPFAALFGSEVNISGATSTEGR